MERLSTKELWELEGTLADELVTLGYPTERDTPLVKYLIDQLYDVLGEINKRLIIEYGDKVVNFDHG